MHILVTDYEILLIFAFILTYMATIVKRFRELVYLACVACLRWHYI
jgi:hypothetical protein